MKMQSSPKAWSASDKFCQLAPLDNTITLLAWLQVTVLNISFGIFSHGWGCCLMKWLPKKSARRCVGIVWLVCRPLVSSPGGSRTQQSRPALLSYYLREAPICRWNTDILQDGNSETRPRLFSAFQSSMWLERKLDRCTMGGDSGRTSPWSRSSLHSISRTSTMPVSSDNGFDKAVPPF